MALLEVRNLKKVYTTRFGGSQVEALSQVDFSVESGEFVAIMGESGSGKTTLLNILAALDKATAGEVILAGEKMSDIRDKELAAYRRNHLGFVFQDFSLLDTFSVRDNILLPLVLNGKDPDYMEMTLISLVKRLGIQELLDKFPYEISGGQKQRAALARAMISEPEVLLADEPTGALDSRASDEVLKLFEDFNKLAQTILMVTHSTKAASHAGRVLFIKDGTVYHQLYRGKRTGEEMYEAISNTLSLLMTGGKDSES